MSPGSSSDFDPTRPTPWDCPSPDLEHNIDPSLLAISKKAGQHSTDTWNSECESGDENSDGYYDQNEEGGIEESDEEPVPNHQHATGSSPFIIHDHT